MVTIMKHVQCSVHVPPVSKRRGPKFLSLDPLAKLYHLQNRGAVVQWLVRQLLTSFSYRLHMISPVAVTDAMS